MLVAINGKVYKYSLVTKECLFEFQSFANWDMLLYDYDDKLIVADQEQLRIWDFHSHREEVPQLITVLEAPLRIECLKVNKVCEEEGERKGVYWFVIATKDEFKVYHGRLDILLVGNIQNNMDSITCLEFGIENKHLYVGTQKGFIH